MNQIAPIAMAGAERLELVRTSERLADRPATWPHIFLSGST